MIRSATVAMVVLGLVAAQEAPQRAIVSGIVVNASNGEPVRKSMVILRAADQAKGISYAAESDGDGKFRIEDVSAGVYSPSAEHQGFMLEQQGAPGAPRSHLTIENGKSYAIRIGLEPLGVITGRVLANDGDPVRGAQVEAQRYEYVNGKRQLTSVEQVVANGQGEFRLFGLRPGRFYLRASSRNGGFVGIRFDRSPATGESRREGLAPTYFPGSSDAAHATPIELATGAQLRGFDIRLQLERRYSVGGKLPAEYKDRASQSFTMELVPRGGDRNMSSSLSFDGENFEFADVTPGSYVIEAMLGDDQKRLYAHQQIEVVNADVDGVALNFFPPLSLSGSVQMAGNPGGKALGGVHVSLETDTPSLFSGANTDVKKDGSFAIQDVAVDVYRLTVGLQPAGTYLKSIRFGDEEAPDGRIDLTKGSLPVVIVLGADVGDLEGTVRKANGDPAARVRVTLFPGGNHAGRSDLFHFEFTDEQGRYHVKNVAPGEYQIFAWEDAPVGAPQDPEFRKRFEKRAAAVKMEPSGHETVDLTAILVKGAGANQLP